VTPRTHDARRAIMSPMAPPDPGRSRSRARRAGEARRIEGLALLRSALPWRRRAGEQLLRRLLREEREDLDAVAGAHAHLAEHYERAGDLARAVAHCRAGLETEQADGGVSYETELRLAALLVATGQVGDSDEPERLLARTFEHGVVDSAEQWRYCVVRARLAALRGRPDEAAFFARVALHVREHDGPTYARHPEVGRVEADRGTVRDVRRLAAGGTAEAYDERLERHRRRDGSLEWDWSLVERLSLDAEQEARLQAVLAEAGAVLDDLRAAGFAADDLAAWARQKLRSAGAVRDAARVLVPWLDRAEHDEVRTHIAHALRDTRARRCATEPLLRLFAGLVGDDLDGEGPPPTEEAAARRRLKDAVGDALATLARDDHFAQVEALIRDRRHGQYRTYLLWALGHMEDPAAVDLALAMLEDDDVSMPALHALGDLRSERAEPVLRRIAAEPRPKRSARDDGADRARARIEAAERGLAKLEKARRASRSVP
jgi:hypothetical protein